MARGVVWSLVAPLVALGLVGCRFFDYEEREPWRVQAEEQCLAEGLVRPSAFLEPRPELNGSGACGMTRPIRVAAVNNGFVAVEPQATLACPMVAGLKAWMAEAVQPAAIAWFGEPVAEIKQISAYSCRTMNGQPGAAISEHAFGNALDIASFRLADGREVDFKTGWKGRPEERGFLRAVHAAACERFTTVLAPGADMFHYDHIHVDLARRASGRTVCKPALMNPVPPPLRPPWEGTPVARAPSPAPSPWAERAPLSQAASSDARPKVIAREADTRPVGPPLVLGNQPPPAQSFGAPLPIAARVRQALGLPQPAPTQAPPAAIPARQNPYGLVPPARIPSARAGTDATVTGSIAPDKGRDEPKKSVKDAKKASSVQPAKSLTSLRSPAAQTPGSEGLSVFDLFPAKQSH